MRETSETGLETIYRLWQEEQDSIANINWFLEETFLSITLEDLSVNVNIGFNIKEENV